MVSLGETPIIERLLDVLSKVKLTKILIVTGYRSEKLKNKLAGRDVQIIHNPRFPTSNMVYSLFCAEKEFNEDLIISYTDIVYSRAVLEKIYASESPLSIVIDQNWESYWKLRMDNPLDDVETLKIDQQGYIMELGKKTDNLADIEGQYIGLLKINHSLLPRVKNFYHSLDRKLIYDGQNFNNMYLTTFLQLLIDHGVKAKPVFINGGWVEIDSLNDLDIYNKNPDFFYL